MDRSLSIGEFARLTHLSVKTLRHYHEVDVLVPVAVDPASGYRRYGTDQVPVAQLVRRLRALDMPLADVRGVLAAGDEPSRNRLILDYLARMEQQLERTRDAVASLRTLLSSPAEQPAVAIRRVPATRTWARSATVDRDDVAPWCGETFPRLYDGLARAGVHATGPAGALYDADFFELGIGLVTAFVPTDVLVPSSGDLEPLTVPAATLAVAVHRGPFDELDRTYGALGAHVAEHEVAAPGPVRELYVLGPTDVDDPAGLRTEVCWPVADPPNRRTPTRSEP